MSPSLVHDLRRYVRYAREAAAEATRIRSKIDDARPDRDFMKLLGNHVHDFYCALEDMAYHFVMAANGDVPHGSASHQLLVARAFAVPDRPHFLFQEDLREDLDALLKFRHFFRHSYPVQLDWEKLRPVADVVPALLAHVERDVEAFAARSAPPPRP